MVSREKVHEKLSFPYFSLKTDTNCARNGLRKNFQPFKIIMELEPFLTRFLYSTLILQKYSSLKNHTSCKHYLMLN